VVANILCWLSGAVIKAIEFNDGVCSEVCFINSVTRQKKRLNDFM